MSFKRSEWAKEVWLVLPKLTFIPGMKLGDQFNLFRVGRTVEQFLKNRVSFLAFRRMRRQVVHQLLPCHLAQGCCGLHSSASLSAPVRANVTVGTDVKRSTLLQLTNLNIDNLASLHVTHNINRLLKRPSDPFTNNIEPFQLRAGEFFWMHLFLEYLNRFLTVIKQRPGFSTLVTGDLGWAKFPTLHNTPLYGQAIENLSKCVVLASNRASGLPYLV